MDDFFLKVYVDRSELHKPGKAGQVFKEGPNNKETKRRYERIVASFKQGFLRKAIAECLQHPSHVDARALPPVSMKLLDSLVESITSEVGRAVVALTILQLSVKAMEPAQSIRLHKGSPTRKDFSWEDGISMRSLDKKFVTPTLRQFDLIRLNADGFMMTRSLAENYPYSLVYKARLRGGREEWKQIVEGVEDGSIPAEASLRYLISRLINRADEFQKLSDRTMKALNRRLTKPVSRSKVVAILRQHADSSEYSARLFEVAIHSLMQALEEAEAIGELVVEPLSQMRSANKKHGNVADVELLDNGQIVEAWDAKYGKAYLRDELEELHDKIPKHVDLETVGFVTSVPPDLREDVRRRKDELEELHGISIEIHEFSAWVAIQFERAVNAGANEGQIASLWLRAYAESLAQRRRTKAPIDEPCQQWLEGLLPALE